MEFACLNFMSSEMLLKIHNYKPLMASLLLHCIHLLINNKAQQIFHNYKLHKTRMENQIKTPLTMPNLIKRATPEGKIKSFSNIQLLFFLAN